MSEIYLSVVLPCFDEMANLQKGVLDKVDHYLSKLKKSYEVIIVDDGSTDGSLAFVEEFVKENSNFKLLKNAHLGKAGAVTAGMLAAVGKYVLFADMDQAAPIEEVEKLLPAVVDEGYAVAIGSRSTTRKGSPLIRIFVSRANMILRKMIVGLSDITDTQCGFKLFTHDAAQKLFTRVKAIHHDFHAISGSNVSSGFDVELLYIAQKMRYRIKEVPIRWLYVETRRVNPVTDSIEGVMELLRIKWNSVKGAYN